MPNFIEIEETFCGRTNGRTYVCRDGRTFETGFIRSTLSKSRPKNEPLWSNFRNFVPKVFTASPIDVVVLKCHKNLSDGKSVKSSIIYLTDTTKYRLPLKLSLLRGSHAKYVRASRQQCTQSAQEFIRIGVIPKRVNTAELPCTVKPIFGGSLASSWIINVITIK